MHIPAEHGPEHAGVDWGEAPPYEPAGHAWHWNAASIYCPAAHTVLVVAYDHLNLSDASDQAIGVARRNTHTWNEAAVGNERVHENWSFWAGK